PADEPGAGGPGALDPPAVAFESPLDPAATRRGFFAWTGAAAAGAAVAGGVGRRLSGATSKVEEARAQVTLPPLPAPEPPAGRLDDVAGISPYLTPNGEFYRIDTALVTPRVDPSSWRLKVRGLVERPFALSFDELLALPSISQAVTIACVSNEVGGELVGNAVWQGVPLAELLDRAGVGADATQVVGRSVDGWTGGFPTEIALDGRPAMVAYAMNGEPLPVRNGFPARLIVPGLYGYVSATKWLTEIELTRLDRFDGYWIPRGWSKLGPIKLQSRIDTPRADDVRRAGPVAVAGVAWAPTRGISGVEVRIGDGAWLPARLGPALSDLTWVQWVFDWDAAPGQHRITVRAIDGDGSIQTADRAPVVPNGATGLHAIWVTVE
ncbi:MAG: molybdopterin-dependent oxidoreductase, partial [Acidimicrobiales bacterium]